MEQSEEDLAEERARQLDNKLISLCVVWFALSIALISYDSIRDLLAPDGSENARAALSLPALAPSARLLLRLFALSFYLFAWRIVLKENPKGGRGLLIGFGVVYLLGMVALSLIKTFIG